MNDSTHLNYSDDTQKSVENEEFGICSMNHNIIKSNALELEYTKEVCMDC